VALMVTLVQTGTQVLAMTLDQEVTPVRAVILEVQVVIATLSFNLPKERPSSRRESPITLTTTVLKPLTHPS